LLFHFLFSPAFASPPKFGRDESFFDLTTARCELNDIAAGTNKCDVRADLSLTRN
jgi:hypothetical protein